MLPRFTEQGVKNLGILIRTKRKESGYSSIADLQKTLTLKGFEVTWNRIQSLESGGNKEPAWDLVNAIAQLGITPYSTEELMLIACEFPITHSEPKSKFAQIAQEQMLDQKISYQHLETEAQKSNLSPKRVAELIKEGKPPTKLSEIQIITGLINDWPLHYWLTLINWNQPESPTNQAPDNPNHKFIHYASNPYPPDINPPYSTSQ